MKVIAFNGGPTMDKGNTEMTLTPFLDGMREDPAEVGEQEDEEDSDPP